MTPGVLTATAMAAAALLGGGTDQQVITPPLGAPFLGFFGQAVAVQGNDLFIGSPLDSSIGLAVGGVYHYQRGPDGVWAFREQLLPPTGVTLPFLNFFGESLAVDGDLLAIGAPRETEITEKGVNFFQGAAYVFQRQPDGTWDFLIRIVEEDIGALRLFGTSVDLFGDTLAVGAPGDNDACPESGFCLSGAVYLYEIDGPTFPTERARLVAPRPEPFDWVGNRVAISGNVVISGRHPAQDFQEPAKGAPPPNKALAYVWERDPATQMWGEGAPVVIGDIGVDPGFAAFTEAVDIDGFNAILGVFYAGEDEEEIVPTGRAWLIEKDMAGRWVATEEFENPEADLGDEFGWAVALRGNRAVVGARSDVSDIGFDSGTALVYTRAGSDANFTLAERLQPDTPSNNELFGFVVGLGPDLVVVTALDENEVHVFDRPFTDAFESGDLYLATEGAPGSDPDDGEVEDAILQINPVTQIVRELTTVDGLDARVATYDPARERLIVGVEGDTGALRAIDSTGEVFMLEHNLDAISDWGDRTIRSLAPAGDGRLYAVGANDAGSVRVGLIAADDTASLVANGAAPLTLTLNDEETMAAIWDSDNDALYIADALDPVTRVHRIVLDAEGDDVVSAVNVVFDAIGVGINDDEKPAQFSAGPNDRMLLKIRSTVTGLESRLQLFDPATLADLPFAASDYTGVEFEEAGTYSTLLGLAVTLDTQNDQLRTFAFGDSGAGTVFVSGDVSDSMVEGEDATLISIGDTISGGPETPPPAPASQFTDRRAAALAETLHLILEHWGPCDRGRGCAGDLNRDGVVDGADLRLALIR